MMKWTLWAWTILLLGQVALTVLYGERFRLHGYSAQSEVIFTIAEIALLANFAVLAFAGFRRNRPLWVRLCLTALQLAGACAALMIVGLCTARDL